MTEKKLRHTIKQGISDLLYIFRREVHNIWSDQALVIFFLLVPLCYPIIYTFIYKNEVVEKAPTAVVDMDNSSTSRLFIRHYSAQSGVAVSARCSDLEQAKELMRQSKIYGILYIPTSFSHDLARGTQTHVSVFSDMSSMLYYKNLLLAATEASLEINKDIRIKRAALTTPRQEQVAVAPIKYQDITLFNPQSGFASFLIPAVLMLIIQQTLLLGIGLAAGTARERNRYHDLIPSNTHYHGTLRIVLGKAMAYILLYAVTSTYMTCLVPKMFGLVQITHFPTLLWLLFPYITACIFFSMTCSIFIHQREACMMIFVFTSVPLLFISGISWPGSAIPPFWKTISYCFPSTFGVNAFAKINTLGAHMSDIVPEYRALWLQTGVYFITTFIVYRYQIIINKRHTMQELLKKRALRQQKD